MPKFKITKIIGSEAIISNDDINHIKKSLRKKINNKLICFDNNYDYECVIKDIENFKLEIIDKKNITNNVKNINIYLGIINKNNFELAVQKINELNCKSITPVYFERSQKNIKLNLERLKKIIFESSKQCYRNTDLIINVPINLDYLLDKIKNNKFNFVAHQETKNKKINLNNLKDEEINLIIGPEGGFTSKEIEIISKISNKIKLSNTILKSETASIFLSSIVIYEMSKLNEKRKNK